MRTVVALLLLLTAASLCARSIAAHHRETAQAAGLARTAQPAEQALPNQFLWIWERPEDLRSLNSQAQGAAIFEGTLHLDNGATFEPRRNPYILPQDIRRIAVARIESTAPFATHHDDTALVTSAVRQLAKIATRPGIAALQIDFDARKSERAFYRNLLTQLRNTMPQTLPLEITALVSWCDEDDWIRTLPINSATPMFFRMEPGRDRFARAQRLSAQLPEPLCNSSIGVSTHEPWPTGIAGRRTYIFPDRGWKQDLALLNQPAVRRASSTPNTLSFRPERSAVEKPAVVRVSKQDKQ